MTSTSIAAARPGAYETIACLAQGLRGFVGDAFGGFNRNVGTHRNEMDMYVPVDTGARAVADVDSDMMMSSPHLFFDDTLGFLEQYCCFTELISGEIGQMADMTIGDDHQMAGRVRISVHHDEGVIATIDDEFLLLFGGEDLVAEDTAVAGFDPENVGQPPRGPDLSQDIQTSLPVVIISGYEASTGARTAGDAVCAENVIGRVSG